MSGRVHGDGRRKGGREEGAESCCTLITLERGTAALASRCNCSSRRPSRLSDSRVVQEVPDDGTVGQSDRGIFMLARQNCYGTVVVGNGQ